MADAYVLLNGSFHLFDDKDAILHCADGVVRESVPSEKVWTRLSLPETPIAFPSRGVSLSGLLVEPARDGRRHPLLVFDQGSEKWTFVSGAYQYLLAAQGVAFFCWDKRGTNHSGGTFTDNFAVLAADTSAALRAVRRAKSSAFSRIGLFGGSQGGWVAPLASLSSPIDFLIVAFGVVGSPVEQDQWQVRQQLHSHGVPASEDKAIDAITAATGEVASSDHPKAGWLSEIRRHTQAHTWGRWIDGQYSGQLLRDDLAGVRRDGPGLMWRYDAVGVLKKVMVPQYWIMAGRDSVAPSAPSIARLQRLQHDCKPISIFEFPKADHGIHPFTISSNGTRQIGLGYSEGYLRLVAALATGAPTPRLPDFHSVNIVVPACRRG